MSYGTGSKKRAALYIRVSSEQQCLDNQRPDLVQLAKARGLEVVVVFEEKVSAAKTRAEFEGMKLAAHRGEFEVLLVWALDRLGRSMVGNLQVVLELDRLGVEIVSLREPWLDTGGPVRSLLIGIFSWVAEQERARIIERTKAGLERARREGKQIGRPRVEVDLDQALLLRRRGLSVREAAKKLGIASSTLHRMLQGHDAMMKATAKPVPKASPASLDPPNAISRG